MCIPSIVCFINTGSLWADAGTFSDVMGCPTTQHVKQSSCIKLHQARVLFKLPHAKDP